MSVLRQLFGPSKGEMWKQLSGEIGANYVAGGFWTGDKVQATHGEWTITLDTYTVSTGHSHIPHTRLRAPYVNPDGFRFNVYRAGLFSKLGEMLGMQDVKVGQEPFDTEFVIKGTSEEKLRELFSNPRIRELLQAQKEVHFGVKNAAGVFGSGYPAGTDELQFTAMGLIKDVERLKGLYELFAETLDQLCKMGSAYENAPLPGR